MEDDFDVKFAEELQMLEGQPTLSVIACVCVSVYLCVGLRLRFTF